MPQSPRTLLRSLQTIQARFGDPEATANKLALLAQLTRRRQARRQDLEALHESLIFLAAHPDDEEVRVAAEAALGGFASRADLRAWRDELIGSGIAGTETHFRFWWVMAEWLTRKWPSQIHLDWDEFDRAEWLTKMLHLLLPYSETPVIDEWDLSAKEWIERLKRPDETDAAFLTRRIAALPIDEFARETLYDTLDVPMVVRPGEGIPTRTLDRWPCKDVAYQTRALDRSRPDLRAAVEQQIGPIHYLSRREGTRLCELARSAMFTRSRDLDAFANSDPDDARIVESVTGWRSAWSACVPNGV